MHVSRRLKSCLFSDESTTHASSGYSKEARICAFQNSGTMHTILLCSILEMGRNTLGQTTFLHTSVLVTHAGCDLQMCCTTIPSAGSSLFLFAT